jgi:hypothetical protein
VRSRARAVAALLVWAAGAALTIGVLARSPVHGDEPVTVGFALLRQAALAAAWYVLAAGVAGAIARALRAATLVRVADALTLAPLRSTLRAALGVGLSGVLTFSTAAVAVGAAPDNPPPIVTLQRLPDGGTPTTTAPPPTTSTTPTTVATTPSTWASPQPSPPEVVRPAPRPAPAPQAPTAHWRVRPGDCFWTIADRVLSSRLGRPVTDREIVPYWRRMITENRSRLRDPANPDLLFPGQVLALP